MLPRYNENGDRHSPDLNYDVWAQMEARRRVILHSPLEPDEKAATGHYLAGMPDLQYERLLGELPHYQ